MRLLPTLLATAASLVCTTAAQAWSFKEHVFVTRLAVQTLLADPSTPPEMKAWLREVAPDAGDENDLRRLLVEEQLGREPVGLIGLDRWVLVPDQARGFDGDAKIPHFDQPESPMHYLDVELFLPGEGEKRYKHDLSMKPQASDVPDDWRNDDRFPQAGYLPWRTQQIYDGLVAAIQQGNLLPAEGDDVNDRDHAVALAGYLIHYVQDNTQPHHATLDFRSASYFAVRHLAPNVHGMFEFGMVDWEGKPFPNLRGELFEKIMVKHAAIQQAKAQAMIAPYRPFEDSLAMSLYSYDLLPLIGEAAQAAVGQKVEGGDPSKPVGPPARERDDFDIPTFFHFTGTARGETKSLLEFKADQLAIAADRSAQALLAAWEEANQ